MPDECIGRERELSLLRDALERESVIAILGVSGVGKSTFARSFLTKLERSGSATREVSCFGQSLREVASLLVGRTPHAEELTTSLLIEAANMLDVDALLLDDIVFDVAELLPLFDSFDGIVVITTNRDVDGVASLPLVPLGLDDPEERKAARQIFRRNLGASLVSDSEGSDAVVDAIVERLGGHPLSIALAGRRAATVKPQGVLALLHDSESLSDPRRDERHRTPATAVRFTWDSLAADERRVLFFLARFGRPLEVDALIDRYDRPVDETIETLRALVVRGVVYQGERVAPLELFAEASRELLPRHDAEVARSVDRAMIETGLETARALPRGYRPVDLDPLDVQFWDRATWVCEGHERTERVDLVGAWLRGMVATIGLSDSGFEWDKTSDLLHELDHPEAWLYGGVAAANAKRFDLAESFINRMDLSQCDDELRCSERLLRGVLLVESNPQCAYEAMTAISETWRDDNPMALYLLGVVAVRINKLDEARRYFKAIVGHPEASPLIEFRALSGLAANEVDLDLAKKRAARLVQHAEAMNVPKLIWYSLRLAAFVGMRRREFDASISLLDRAIAQVERIDLQFARELMTDRALALLSNGKFETVLDVCDALLMTGDERRVRVARAGALWQIDRSKLEQIWRNERAELGVDEGRVHPLVRLIDVDLMRGRGVLDAHIEASPADAPFLRAIDEGHEIESPEAAIEARRWVRDATRAIESNTVRTVTATQFEFWIERSAAPLLQVMADVEASDGIAFLAASNLLWAHGEWHSTERMATAMSIFEFLANRDRPADHRAIGNHLYPGELVTEGALKNRIDVQLSKLRRAGLKPYLIKEPEGFVLEGNARTLTSLAESGGDEATNSTDPGIPSRRATWSE